MAVRRAPPRFRVGRVSYYLHHGSWYLYYKEDHQPRRLRVGPCRAQAERAAAIKNAELVLADTSESLPAAMSRRSAEDVADRRTLFAGPTDTVSEFLHLEPGAIAVQGIPADPLRPLLRPVSPPAVSIGALREAFLEYHNEVLQSALGTVRRYAAATRHLLQFATQWGSDDLQVLSAAAFTKYLRRLEVAPNGHANAQRRPLSDKGIKFILQTCGAMFRYGLEHGHVPKGTENPFSKVGLGKMKVRDAKPIYWFDANAELAFFRAADPWSFAVHFTLAKTGLRPGELVHALIEDLDLERGWLLVCGKPALGWQVKTGTEREVPFSAEVVHVLRQVIADRRAGPVFLRVKLGPNNPPVIDGDRSQLEAVARQRLQRQQAQTGRRLSREQQAAILRRVWRDAGAVPADRLRSSMIRVANKIGLRATCPKSWRHTFATLLQEANVDPLIRQITLGHRPTSPEQSALGMTGVYTHTQPEVQHREILRALRLRGASLDLARVIGPGSRS